jgi:hypothetical protein
VAGNLNVSFNVENIIMFLTALSMVGGVFLFLYRIARRIEKATGRIEVHRDDIKILMRSEFTCLDGLTQLGANGEVTKMKQEMKDYLIGRGVVE